MSEPAVKAKTAGEVNGSQPEVDINMALAHRPGAAPIAQWEWDLIKDQAKYWANASVILPEWINKASGGNWSKAAYILTGVISKGRELGLQPMYTLEHVALIKGKTSLSSQAMLALINSRLGRGSVTPVEMDETHATFRFRDPSVPDFQPPDLTVTIEQAKKRGWTTTRKDGKEVQQPSWSMQPEIMLRWRCIAEGARLYFPDIIAGVYMAGETDAPYRIEGGNVVIDAELLAEPETAVTSDGKEYVVETGEVVDAHFTQSEIVDENPGDLSTEQADQSFMERPQTPAPAQSAPQSSRDRSGAAPMPQGRDGEQVVSDALKRELVALVKATGVGWPAGKNFGNTSAAEIHRMIADRKALLGQVEKGVAPKPDEEMAPTLDELIALSFEIAKVTGFSDDVVVDTAMVDAKITDVDFADCRQPQRAAIFKAMEKLKS